MASNQVMKITLAIAVILLPTIAIAKEFVVGDSSGWTNDFDYQDWAKDKVFRVGDKLGIHLYVFGIWKLKEKKQALIFYILDYYWKTKCTRKF